MYNLLSIKIISGKLYLFRFEAALLVFIFGILSNLPAKAQSTNQLQRNFYSMTGIGLKEKELNILKTGMIF